MNARRWRRRLASSLLGAFSCLLQSVLGSAQTEPTDLHSHSELIDAVLEAYGGLERLSEIDAYRMEGNLDAHARGRHGHTTRSFARPDRLRVEIRYPDRNEVRVLDGDVGWRGPDSRPLVAASGPMLSAMMAQAARANLPWILDEQRASVGTTDPIELDGRDLVGLELVLREGLIFRAYLDPDSYLVLQTRSSVKAGPMDMVFETYFTDFREIDGVLFAFKEDNYVSGTHTGTTIIETVELNPDLGSGEFTPSRKRTARATSSMHHGLARIAPAFRTP